MWIYDRKHKELHTDSSRPQDNGPQTADMRECHILHFLLTWRNTWICKVKLKTVNSAGLICSLEVRSHSLWLSFNFLKISERKIQVIVKIIQLFLGKSRQQKHTNDPFHYVTLEC